MKNDYSIVTARSGAARMLLGKILRFVVPALLLMSATSHAQYARLAARSATSADSKGALRRLGLERAWQTQIEFDASRGGLSGVNQHISSESAQTIYEVTYPGGRKTFSDRDLDVFGKTLGPKGAKKEAEYWIATWKSRTKSEVEPTITEHVVPDVVVVATSERGTVQCINGETGRTLWTTKVGSVRHPTLTPGINEKYVAVINGSTLYLLDRADGDLVWERRTTHPPGAGPAMSEQLIFVPMIDGHMEIFNIDEPKRPAGFVHCMGRCMIQPVVFRDVVAWPTDKGNVYVGNSEVPGVRFRVTAGGSVISAHKTGSAVAVAEHAEAKRLEELFREGKLSIEDFRKQLKILRASTSMVDATTVRAAPTFSAGFSAGASLMFFASADGNVYAVDTVKGTVVNRFSAGEPISLSPIVVRNWVYVITDEGTIFCANPDVLQGGPPASGDDEVGQERWFVSGVKSFLAANLERVYCLDQNRRVIGIDAKTGSVLGAVDVGAVDYSFVNTQSDRIYIGTSAGTLECLRETRQRYPFVHGGMELQRKLPQVKLGGDDEEKPKTEDKPTTEDEDPFGGPAKPEKTDEPAEPAEKEPAMEDDPFK